MRWSRSEFLNLLELRSQCWCFSELDGQHGFTVSHNEAVIFYAALIGNATVAGIGNGSIDLSPGDVVMILSGERHAVRSQPKATTRRFDFLNANEYVDVPPTFPFGDKPPVTRLLCGRLKTRWPGDQRLGSLPTHLRTRTDNSVVNFDVLQRSLHASGAAALLTQSAQLLFSAALREHPNYDQLFIDTDRLDPVQRALHFLEKHPFQRWTVEDLAHKVGMSRSNFAARFVERVGQTPMEYLTDIRMQHAARMLKQSDLTIAAISERVGYSSQASFNRRFTRFHGVSPGNMRKSVRENE